MTRKTDQHAAVARLSHFVKDEDAISKQLLLILDSQVFKGSRRSQEFLRFVVEKSLAGHCDDLKERIIGTELFNRPSTYDTSQDAIVRVTASDVRKRLAHYYEKSEETSEFRIDLPSGSYIPEFSRIAQPHRSLSALPETEMLAFHSPSSLRAPVAAWRRWIHAPVYLVALAALAILVWRPIRNYLEPPPRLVLPWSAIFRDNHKPQLIFCDAALPVLQDFLRTDISLSDYAARKFVPDELLLRPDARRVSDLLAGPDFRAMAAPVDLRIASQISELAAESSYQVRPRSARELQF